MNKSLKILHLEDLHGDADLVARILKKSGIRHTFLHADNKVDFIRALRVFGPDVIVSDHSLPSFDSHEALLIIKESNLNIPFILVTATVSEEYAVSIIKDGAADYILKDRLQRLPSAIISAIDKVKAAKALEEHRSIQEKLLAAKALQAQERERNEIGKELHDNINQVLVAAKLYIQFAMKKKEADSDLLQKGHDYILMAINEIRKLSHTLVAPSLGEVTLADAVRELINDLGKTTSLNIKLLTSNFANDIVDEEKSLMFYRIIQEQMNNILKHAQAKNVVIHFSQKANHIILTITDDGVGFDLTKTGAGIGLRNISSRAAFFNGTIEVISSLGEGCSLEIIIPINKNNLQIKHVDGLVA